MSLKDDSRAVAKGDGFVAVRGVAVDGHRYLEAAAEAGAGVLIVEAGIPLPDGLERRIPVIRVADSRVALARLAAAYHGLRPPGPGALRLIGITGTNGKTTVSWMVRSILRAAGRKAGLIGTIGYDLVGEREKAPLTTPGPLRLCACLARAAQAGAEDMVLEVSSHALDQHRCDGLTFAAGLFTNLSGDHLDYHETMDRYKAAKRRLFSELSDDALAVVNVDDPVGEEMARATHAAVIRYGLESSQAQVRARIKSLDLKETRFFLTGCRFEAPLRLSLIGRHNVANALAAAATAEALGIEFDAICAGLEGLTGVPGRLEQVQPVDWPAAVYVDYAHTDDALDNVLSVLRPLTSGRLICVFGCGGDRDRGKRPRMARVVQRWADLAWVTSDNPRSEDPEAIIKDIMPGFAPGGDCRVAVDANRRTAIEAAVAQAGAGDAVLIAGKGHEDYQLVGSEVLQFDDREVAREAIEKLAGRAEDAA